MGFNGSTEVLRPPGAICRMLSRVKSTFAFTAAKLWNALTDNIQSIGTPGSFKRAFYMFLIRKYEAYDANPFLYR